MDVPKPASWNLHTRISSLLQKESGSDVEFQVGQPPRRFACHKVILAAGSPVFETMFFGTIRQKSPVCVPDLTAKGFDFLLQYLYADKMTIKDEIEAFEAAYAAKKYMVKSLFTLCEGFLLKNYKLNSENVFETYEEATLLEMKKLQNQCLRYVSRNTRTVFNSRSFTKASKDTFQDILRLDLMDIDTELEIVEALWLWGKEQCKESGIECTIENVRSHTKELLKYVRFFALEVNDITNILEKCQLLDVAEEMALLWNIALPRTTRPITMPSNISTESKKRSILNSTKIEFPAEYRYDGNMTDFLIQNHQSKIELTVTGPPVTIVGVVVAFKAIPCYSCTDRSLEVEVSVTNSSNSKSVAKSRFKAESSKEEAKELLLLDTYVLLEEQQCLTLTVTATGEGVRLMQCAGDRFHRRAGESEICFSFKQNEKQQNFTFPIKELMIV